MSAEVRSLKRVRRKIKTSQNPLFEKWLKEWKDEAASKGSDMQFCFAKALKSLQKFPVKLYSGKECMMLENFGAKLCQKLEEKLQAYKAIHPEDVSVNRITENEVPLQFEKTEKITKKRKSTEGSPIKKKRMGLGDRDDNSTVGRSNYAPAYRSGAYAILVTMYEKSHENNFKGYLTKTEIENEAQDLCDSSFKKPNPGSYYTAWSSMGVLIKKKLVNKEGGRPVRYSLTEEGVLLASKLKQVDEGLKAKDNFASPMKDPREVTREPVSPLTPRKIDAIRSPQKEIYAIWSPQKKIEAIRSPQKEIYAIWSPQKKIEAIRSPQKKIDAIRSPRKQNEVNRSPQKKVNEVFSQEQEPISEEEETIFMPAGTFEIVLLVDIQERDEKAQQANNMTMRQLKSKSVNFEIRHLKVGDFVWIARDINSGYELVLPYIVERKRYDDLASSIKDGRFHEQKFRLKQSGIENLIYLVEKYGNENQRLGLPLPTLLQAMANTQVVDGFTVRETNNHDHSMRYLDRMTTQLNNLFRTKTLMSCKKSNLSPANLSDDLVSLMSFKEFNKGSEKNKKPTVRNMLVKQLVQLSGVSIEKAQAIVQLYPTPKALVEGLKGPNGEKTIADLTFGTFNRSIGPMTAKQILMLYTCPDLR